MRILRKAQASEKTGFSSSHLDRLVRLGQFPKKVALGPAPNSPRGYFEHEVDDWLAERGAERDGVAA